MNLDASGNESYEIHSSDDDESSRQAITLQEAAAVSVKLHKPASDVVDPEVSVVVPALNEELTIREFIAWCHTGFERAGVIGEVLIIDSSSDRTAEMALAAGARVLKCPKRGLGRAYIDAIPYIRGDFVVMGDADCTYDFRDIKYFVDKFHEGFEYVMGSRWLGSIEKGSMPAAHRYFGTPVTTWILNRVYGARFTDIHCGMRGITRQKLVEMGLSSQSWEYASEMVLKSVRMSLKTVEVPVAFLKDREGRISHHKRAGWWSPIQAAWINLRAMFIYRGEYFAIKPGLALLVSGLVITLPLTFGAISVGRVTFNIYWMLLGVMLSLVGLHSFFFGCFAQMFADYTGRAGDHWRRVFRYTRTTILAIIGFCVGLSCCAALAADYISNDFRLPAPTSLIDHLGVTGLLLTMASFSSFCFTLALHSTSVRYGRLDDGR